MIASVQRLIVDCIVLFLFKDLELVALFAEPLDAFGEGGTEFVDGFKGVVEGDDAAVAGVALHVVDDVVGGQPFGVVAGDQVPHHHLVFTAEQGVLRQPHPAVGRAEEVGVDVGVGLLDVVTVFVKRVADAADVVVGVVSYLVPLGQYALVEFWIFAHVVAYHEEGGVDAILAEHIEDEWRGLGDWTVVEGQID